MEKMYNAYFSYWVGNEEVSRSFFGNGKQCEQWVIEQHDNMPTNAKQIKESIISL